MQGRYTTQVRRLLTLFDQRRLLGGTFIYHLQAPDSKALPYVVWNWQGGGLTPDHDIISGLEWIRAYGTSAAQAGSIYGGGLLQDPHAAHAPDHDHHAGRGRHGDGTAFTEHLRSLLLGGRKQFRFGFV